MWDLTSTRIPLMLPLRQQIGMVKFATWGPLGGDLAAVDKVLRKLISAGNKLHVVYEAGPCGFVLYRHLAKQGIEVEVYSPSSIPKAPGERIKNDRRDAIMLARLARSGDLTGITVPDAADEAVRDLLRARTDIVYAQRTARQQLKAILLRNDIRYVGKSSWTAAHLRWIEFARAIAFERTTRRRVKKRNNVWA